MTNQEYFQVKNNGFTLTEILIAAAVFGILVIALGMSFEGWQGGYRIESQIKELYDDLMNARMRAMQRNRVHFVTLSNLQYSVWEDIDPWPDGNGILDANDDNHNRPPGYSEPIPLLQKDLNPKYAIEWSDVAYTQIAFSKRGLPSKGKTICVFTDFDGDKKSDVEPDYDCIVISATRINMGKLTKQDTDGGICKSISSGGHCEPK